MQAHVYPFDSVDQKPAVNPFNTARFMPLDPPNAPATALDTQVGGGHYKKLAIQPVEYCHANGIPFLEGNAIKYLTRWRDKGGVDDLKKARHMIDMLIDLEAAKTK